MLRTRRLSEWLPGPSPTSVEMVGFSGNLLQVIFNYDLPRNDKCDSMGLTLADKLQSKLRTGGGIKALLGMVRCGHADVLAQVARGIANFAKCESRAYSQGNQHCHLFDPILDS